MTISIPPESVEPQVPVLNLVAANLVKDPEWSIRLLESLASQLSVPVLRQERDSATELAEAIDAGLKLAHREPEGVEDWVALAHLLTKANRLNESLGWVDRALEKKPGVADDHRLRASVLERLGRFEEALPAAKRALELRPDDGELAADLARIETAYWAWLRRQRDGSQTPKSAIEAGLKLAHREPDEVEDWMALAHLLAKAGRLNESLGWVDRALEKKPGVADDHRLRASVLERLGRFEEASEAAVQALALEPDDAELDADLKRINAAYMNLLRQQRDGSPDLTSAIEAGLKLAHREPEGVEDWMALAHLLAKADRLNESLGWIDHALEKKPGAADDHRLRASVLERLGRFEEALPAAKRALELAPEDSELAADLERIEAAYSNWLRQQRDGLPDLASAIEVALKLACRKPENVDDWASLAHLLAKAERLTEALKWIERVISHSPRVAEYHRFRSSVLERLGQFKKAYYAARKARLLDPGNPALVEDVRRTITKTILHYVGLSVLLRSGLFERHS